MLDRKLLKSAYNDIEIIRKALLEVREQVDVHEPRYESLLNLHQYLRLRQDDWTKLQEKLFVLSLSSLGRSYAHVGASIDTLHDQLCSSLGYEEISEDMMKQLHHLSIEDSIEIASRNATMLFGGKSSSRLSKQSTSLMITIPSNAMEDDGLLIKKLAHSKISVFRINTAHDDVKFWRQIAKCVLNINETLEKKDKIKIFVDLAGPKIRTGRIQKVSRPLEVGSNKVAKEVLLFSGNQESKSGIKDPKTLQEDPAQIVVTEEFLHALSEQSVIKIKDSRGKHAKMRVQRIESDKAVCTIKHKLFLDERSFLTCKDIKSEVRNIALVSESIRVFIGDEVVITQEDIAAKAAQKDANGVVIKPAVISCSHNGVLENVLVGDHVFIDDGKIGLKVVQKRKDAIVCNVVIAKEKGSLIKEQKGINFPDTHIQVPALTNLDRQNLLLVIDFVDSVSLSFCQSAEDVKSLQELLHKHGKDEVGIIAKIETKQAVINMPEILKQLLKSKNSGVMIARGDLAIEVGFENLAYIQEMLLDICDAAHIPVIWATQVLESKMKHNLPSRAEVTDAAMSSRAECVMLNKGPFAFDTIGVLTAILHEMHKLFKKNQQLLNKETLWHKQTMFT